MEIELDIVSPGVIIVCPPVLQEMHAVLQALRNGSAKVVVIHSDRRILKADEAFSIYKSATLGQMARVGEGVDYDHVMKGLQFFWSRIKELQEKPCGVIAFENPQEYPLENIKEAIEAVWAGEEKKPEWYCEFLTGDMTKIFHHFFSKTDLKKMKRWSSNFQELQA